MGTNELLKLNPLLMDRVRLAILSILVKEQVPLDFNTMIQRTNITKGNYSTHVQKLEQGGLVKIEKRFISRKPITTYTYTTKGKDELLQYINTIEGLLQK